MNTKHLSIRRRRGGWFQVRTRYCAFYVRLGRGAVHGDYGSVPAPTNTPRRLLGVNQTYRP